MFVPLFTWILPLLYNFAGYQFLRPTPCARGSQNILAPAPLSLPPAQIRIIQTQLCLASHSPSWSRPYLKNVQHFIQCLCRVYLLLHIQSLYF